MRRLTTAILGIAFVVGGLYAFRLANPQKPLAAKPEAEVAPVVQEIVSSGDGNRFVIQTLETVEDTMNLVAKVRQRVQIGESELTGTGEYWQQAKGNLRRTRWSVQTLVAEGQGSYLQVFDGQTLWTDLHLPSKHEVTKLNLTDLRRQLAASSAATTGGISRTIQNLILTHRGGLTQLLDELVQRFDFDQPQPMWWGDQSVYALIGHWKPGQVAKLWPDLKPTDPWPEALPHHVLLMVGKTDLLPYLIEYRSGSDATLAKAKNAFDMAPSPLTRYEFFDVQIAQTIDPRLKLFVYEDSDARAVDVTDQVFERLVPPKAEPQSTVATHLQSQR
ncbi:MAG: hypothetical protein RH917_07770 [Lacipirellulaceae bacterium]